jgi:SAM-dependent methyltransferase
MVTTHRPFHAPASIVKALGVPATSRQEVHPLHTDIPFAPSDSFRKSGASTIKFGVTYTVSGKRRTGEDVKKLYPPQVWNKVETDDLILDIGTGEGNLIYLLRKDGHSHAYGIDKARGADRLTPNTPILQLDLQEAPANLFRNVDHIFSTWSLFTYPETLQFKQQALKKLAGWLRPGGKIYLTPVNPIEVENWLKAVPELTLSEIGEGSYHHVVLTKRRH